MKSSGSSEASSPIWHRPFELDALNTLNEGSMAGRLGIRIVEMGPDFLKGAMPVSDHTRQPFGLLHGGASVVLAETLGSIAANCCVDPEQKRCVGLEINANHLRAVRGGTVIGTARPLHLGGKTQVWSVHIEGEDEKLVCASRLTLAVLDR